MFCAKYLHMARHVDTSRLSPCNLCPILICTILALSHVLSIPRGSEFRGVDDLREGMIRTPLSPMITFQDDPLRVLRAVRFAARFGFSLHEVSLVAWFAGRVTK